MTSFNFYFSFCSSAEMFYSFRWKNTLAEKTKEGGLYIPRTKQELAHDPYVQVAQCQSCFPHLLCAHFQSGSETLTPNKVK